jgi:hypothetical protein
MAGRRGDDGRGLAVLEFLCLPLLQARRLSHGQPMPRNMSIELRTARLL